jgi:hypothetical protein
MTKTSPLSTLQRNASRFALRIASSCVLNCRVDSTSHWFRPMSCVASCCRSLPPVRRSTTSCATRSTLCRASRRVQIVASDHGCDRFRCDCAELLLIVSLAFAAQCSRVCWRWRAPTVRSRPSWCSFAPNARVRCAFCADMRRFRPLLLRSVPSCAPPTASWSALCIIITFSPIAPIWPSCRHWSALRRPPTRWPRRSGARRRARARATSATFTRPTCVASYFHSPHQSSLRKQAATAGAADYLRSWLPGAAATSASSSSSRRRLPRPR